MLDSACWNGHGSDDKRFANASSLWQRAHEQWSQRRSSVGSGAGLRWPWFVGEFVFPAEVCQGTDAVIKEGEAIVVGATKEVGRSFRVATTARAIVGG